MASLILAAGCGLAVSACATVSVQTDSDQVTKDGLQSAKVLGDVENTPFSPLVTVSETSAALLTIAKQFESEGRTDDAAGCYLKVAVDAHALLASGSESPGSEAEKELIQIQNSSLARFAELWMNDTRRMGPGPFRFRCAGETLEIHSSADSTYAPGYFDRIIAAESIEEQGMVRKSRSGCGAALVGIREHRPERAEEMAFAPHRGFHLPATLTIDSSRKQDGITSVTVSLRNPLLKETVAIGGRNLPLAADLSAPIAMRLEGRNQTKWGLEQCL